MDPERRWFAVVALVFILGACSSSSQEGGAAGAPSAYKLRGNELGSETCMTTMSALLSQPEKFDGRLVSFHAWIDQVNGVILLFPSRDELDARDSFSSLVAYPESSPGAFREIPSVEGGEEKFLRVTGTFRWNRDGAPKSPSAPVDVDRMGVMEGVHLGL
ncbi:hypothetical protein G6F65_017380 [Rhizopus arrhizus]|nr:hypothetical protein G6F65_017380 [Rhizopus arrhizus]